MYTQVHDSPLEQFGLIAITLPNISDQNITALSTIFQFSDTLNISGGTAIRQYMDELYINIKILFTLEYYRNCCI